MELDPKVGSICKCLFQKLRPLLKNTQLYPSYPGPQAGYLDPPASYAVAGPGNFPGHSQPCGPAVGPWMPASLALWNCPPGLEYLAQIDQLLVRQKVGLLETIVYFET